MPERGLDERRAWCASRHRWSASPTPRKDSLHAAPNLLKNKSPQLVHARRAAQSATRSPLTCHRFLDVACRSTSAASASGLSIRTQRRARSTLIGEPVGLLRVAKSLSPAVVSRVDSRENSRESASCRKSSGPVPWRSRRRSCDSARVGGGGSSFPHPWQGARGKVVLGCAYVNMTKGQLDADTTHVHQAIRVLLLPICCFHTSRCLAQACCRQRLCICGARCHGWDCSIGCLIPRSSTLWTSSAGPRAGTASAVSARARSTRRRGRG